MKENVTGAVCETIVFLLKGLYACLLAELNQLFTVGARLGQELLVSAFTTPLHSL